MHLLVLSAFRLRNQISRRFVCPCVSMHLLVLSAFRPGVNFRCRNPTYVSMHLLVLSAFRLGAGRAIGAQIFGLNAPFGAQCFPTEVRPGRGQVGRSQCTFWCSVLSDRTRRLCHVYERVSQCTFWCSVLSDLGRRTRTTGVRRVSMHLLVLSAFRLACPVL